MLRIIKQVTVVRVSFFFQIYMINLRHDFVVYVYLCPVRHNLLFGRSREDLLDLQRGRIQKFLFDRGLRGRSGSNLKSRCWAIHKLILLPLKSKLAVKKNSSPVTLLTCNHVPVSRKSRKLFGPRKMFCACVCIQIKIRGPFFERPGNFSGPKANFEIQTCWIVAQLMAHKPVNFASLTDSFILLFQNYWNFDIECKHNEHNDSFPARKVTETFEKQSRLTFSLSDKRSGSEIRCCETNLPVTQWHVFRLQIGPKASSPRIWLFLRAFKLSLKIKMDDARGGARIININLNLLEFQCNVRIQNKPTLDSNGCQPVIWFIWWNWHCTFICTSVSKLGICNLQGCSHIVWIFSDVNLAFGEGCIWFIILLLFPLQGRNWGDHSFTCDFSTLPLQHINWFVWFQNKMPR